MFRLRRHDCCGSFTSFPPSRRVRFGPKSGRKSRVCECTPYSYSEAPAALFISAARPRACCRDLAHLARGRCLALRWKHDAVYQALVPFYLMRSAYVSATIGRDYVDDLVLADCDPLPVHFDFVVVAKHATLSRAAIGVIAAGASVSLKQLVVKTMMQFIMADPEISFLGGRA